MICIYIAVKFNVWIKLILFHMNKYSPDKDSHSSNKLCLLCGSQSSKIWASFWENRIFAYAKTKPQISCMVTAQLISAFVFATWIIQSPLLPKSEISNL